MRKILSGSRFLVILAVVGILLASATALLYAAVATVKLVIATFQHSAFDHYGARRFAVELTELIDLFMLGTVLYIIALGLYELFIDDQIPLPRWLRFHSLNDLKVGLLGVIVVLLGVSFLGEVVDWQGGPDIMYLGIAIAVLVLAMTPVIWLHSKHPKDPPDPPQERTQV